MLTWILQTDIRIFTLFNNEWHNRVLDAVMPVITYIGTGGAIWLLIMLLAAVFGKGEGRKIAFLGTTAIILGSLLGEEILKNLVARPRPFQSLDHVRLLVGMPHGYSFPSGHTTISFAAATAIFGKHKRLGVAALVLAALIGFSRVYVGVHYPFDVLGGVLVGILSGWLPMRFESTLDRIVMWGKGKLKLTKQSGA